MAENAGEASQRGNDEFSRGDDNAHSLLSQTAQKKKSTGRASPYTKISESAERRDPHEEIAMLREKLNQMESKISGRGDAIKSPAPVLIGNSNAKTRFDIEIILENETGIGDADEIPFVDDALLSHEEKNSLRSYTVEDDMQILELFRIKERIGKYRTSPLYESKRKRLVDELQHTFDSMRDRYKRYLKHLTAEEIDIIKTIAADEPDKYFIYFERGRGSKARRFRDVLRAGPRKISAVRKDQIGHSQAHVIVPASPSGRRKRGDGGDMPKIFVRPPPPIEEKSPSKRHRGSSKDYLGDIVDEVYDYVSVNNWQTSQEVKNATEEYTKNFKERNANVHVNYDGREYLFEYLPIRRMGEKGGLSSPSQNAFLESMATLLGCSVNEMSKIFDGLSQDVEDLKHYIAGNKALLWTQLEDQTLLSYLEDPKGHERFYNKLVEDKGEKQVNKRVTFLTGGKPR